MEQQTQYSRGQKAKIQSSLVLRKQKRKLRSCFSSLSIASQKFVRTKTRLHPKPTSPLCKRKCHLHNTKRINQRKSTTNIQTSWYLVTKLPPSPAPQLLHLVSNSPVSVECQNTDSPTLRDSQLQDFCVDQNIPSTSTSHKSRLPRCFYVECHSFCFNKKHHLLESGWEQSGKVLEIHFWTNFWNWGIGIWGFQNELPDDQNGIQMDRNWASLPTVERCCCNPHLRLSRETLHSGASPMSSDRGFLANGYTPENSFGTKKSRFGAYVPFQKALWFHTVVVWGGRPWRWYTDPILVDMGTQESSWHICISFGICLWCLEKLL